MSDVHVPDFLNRDPIEEAGGLNLYGFCGNDGINNFDIMGNSWLSKLWDRTVGSLGKKIAINWDHGRNDVIMAAAIVVSCFVGYEVALWAQTELAASYYGVSYAYMADLTATYGSEIVPAFASVAGGAAGGAAGGFVSGASLGAMSGQHLGEALQSGLKGAEYGAIEGGITAGEDMLNGKGDLFNISGLPQSPGDYIQDTQKLAGRGLEGALANILEDKNASSGFWSGIISGAGSLYAPAAGTEGWYLWNTVAKGVLGGLGSMNKYGKGFMTGFWSAEATAGSNIVDYDLKTYDPSGKGFVNDALGVAARGILGGAAARFGFKTFSSGLFTGGASEFLRDVVPNPSNPEKPLSFNSAVNSGFKLLQPKVTKRGVTYPLNSISGGTWGRGASWAQLFAPQVTGN